MGPQASSWLHRAVMEALILPTARELVGGDVVGWGSGTVVSGEDLGRDS
jgi:hypothetical protein